MREMLFLSSFWPGSSVGLERQPVTLEVDGSSPFRVANAAVAQSVERILGKDEVPGPNPGSSSTKKFLIYVLLAEIRDFFASKSSEIRNMEFL